jgi:hypothetical protein
VQQRLNAAEETQMGNEFLKADASLTKDLKAARTPDEIRELLGNAVDRSQIGYRRDPATGKFIATGESADTEAARAAAAAADTGHIYTRTVNIGGKDFDFTSTDPDLLEHQILSAQAVVAELTNPANQTHHEQTSAERAADSAMLQLKMQRGEISLKEYLERSDAVKDYLANQGISIDTLRENAQKQEGEAYQKSWAQATETFLNGPGASWPRGNRNLAQMQTAVLALGLQDAEDKVDALLRAYEYLKQNDMLFERDTTPTDVIDSLKSASPQEILEAWKQAQPGAGMGDGTAANAAFIESFRRR